MTTLERSEVDVDDVDAMFDDADLWAIILWNDDVNTFENVIRALMEILSHSEERANDLAWKVHRSGRATVAVRPREEAEAAVRAFHARTIQATMARA